MYHKCAKCGVYVDDGAMRGGEKIRKGCLNKKEGIKKRISTHIPNITSSN